MKRGRMQLKDITNLQVVRAVRVACIELARTDESSRLTARHAAQVLMDDTGAPEKLAYAALFRATDRGLLNYGVSVRMAWLEDKALEMLTPDERAEYEARREEP